MLFESTPRLVCSDEAVTIEAVALPNLTAAALDAAAHADRIELCGGIGVEDVARVVEAVGDRADVRANRYGFESLAQIAEYARRFGRGEPTAELFAYPAPESATSEHDGLLVAAVADDEALAEAARLVLRRAAGSPALIELYGGLGARGAALVRAATDGAVPVGFVD